MQVLPVLLSLAATIAPAEPAAATQALTCRVVDADSGELLPCRVYLQAGDGSWHFVHSVTPEGSAIEYRKQRFPTSLEMHTTVSAHPFAADLPPGTYKIRVERGKEYFPAERRFEVADESIALTIELKRWIDMAELGWYSGDTHVHRTVEELRNVLPAEDVNVGLPLSYWVTRSHTPPSSGDKNTDTQIAAEPIKLDPTHVIYPVNTEYEIFSVGTRRHTLGAVFALGHTEPLSFGVPPAAQVAAQARRQGALLDLDKHSWPWSLMIAPVMQVDLFELANNHVWRTEFGFCQWTIETAPEYMNLEMDSGGFTEWGWIDFGMQTYYALLNFGLKMRPSAGTASGVHPVPLGFGRVYVQLEDGFSYEKWMKGLDAGRSFVTTGPMVFVEIAGQAPGSTIRREAARYSRCRIAGTVLSSQPIKPIEVVANGRIATRVPAENEKTTSGACRSPFEAELPIEGTSWIAVRVFEDRPDGRVRFAHSSPVHIEVPSMPLYPREEEVDYFVGRMREELERNADVLDQPSLEEYRRALEFYESKRELLERVPSP